MNCLICQQRKTPDQTHSISSKNDRLRSSSFNCRSSVMPRWYHQITSKQLIYGFFFVIILSSRHDKSAKELRIYQNYIYCYIDLQFSFQLFKHIAQCLSDFIKHNKLETEILPLGFTFSFPLQQLGLRKGLLERWTKGFSCSGVVGQDVVSMLENAIVKAVSFLHNKPDR